MPEVLLRLEGVDVFHDAPTTRKHLLKQLDLTVARGDFLAIIGANGSGKSVLGRVLAGVWPSLSGRYEVLAGTTFQIVFQQPTIGMVGATVLEEIAFGLECRQLPASDRVAIASYALQAVGLTASLHQPIEQLSGGQKMLLAIASAIALDPDVFLFDEVTAMAHPRLRRHLVSIARQLHAAGKTVVWITQFVQELVFADRIICLDEGAIRFCGLPGRFFYDQNDEHPVICETMGYALPPAIAWANQRSMEGKIIASHPLTVHDVLGESVRR
nr:ATP-binding cassette domain-containing protein [Bacilli bacterium]